MKKLTHLILFISLFLGSMNNVVGQKRRMTGIKTSILRYVPGTATRQRHKDISKGKILEKQLRDKQNVILNMTPGTPEHQAQLNKFGTLMNKARPIKDRVDANQYQSKWKQPVGRIKKAFAPVTKKSFWLGKKTQPYTTPTNTIAQPTKTTPQQKPYYDTTLDTSSRQGTPAPRKGTYYDTTLDTFSRQSKGTPVKITPQQKPYYETLDFSTPQSRGTPIKISKQKTVITGGPGMMPKTPEQRAQQIEKQNQILKEWDKLTPTKKAKWKNMF